MTYHRSRGGSRRPKISVIFGILVMVLVLVAGGVLFGGRIWYQDKLKPISDKLTSKPLVIVPGASIAEIGRSLEASGIIRSGKAFEWYVRSSGYTDKLKAGTYSLHPNQSVQEITKMIVDGKVSTAEFTILPGKRLDQIKQSFLDAGFGKDIVENSFKSSNYKNLPALTDKPPLADLEGYLYPETFQMTDSTTPQQLITQSLNEMSKRLTPELRSGFAKQGLSMHEAIILASIVEMEVNTPDDRRGVAQVFLKRLRTGIALGSDSTYHYAAAIMSAEPNTNLNSPYNTRKVVGLPPGPISNVSMTSLEAVANPANANYLYFVSGDDGVTHFSNTLAEHDAMTAQYCKKLCSVY